MSENTKPAADDNETPEVEAHSASVLDLQGTESAVAAPDGNCISLLSVVETQPV